MHTCNSNAGETEVQTGFEASPGYRARDGLKTQQNKKVVMVRLGLQLRWFSSCLDSVLNPAINSSFWEVEAEGSEVQVHPQLRRI